MDLNSEDPISLDLNKSSTTERIPLTNSCDNTIPPNIYFNDVISSTSHPRSILEATVFQDDDEMNVIKNRGSEFEYQHKHFDDGYQRGIFANKSLKIIALILLCIIFIVVLYMSTEQQQQQLATNNQLNELNASKQIMANFTLNSSLMSVDYDENVVILSQHTIPKHHKNTMIVQRFTLNNSNTQFSESIVSLPNGMDRCRQLSDKVYCCFVNKLANRGTHCYTRDGNDNRHSYISGIAQRKFWQTFQVEGTMVGVECNNEYRILDTKKGVVYPVSYDEKPTDLIAVSFFFPMENTYELAELAIHNDESFFICEYVKISTQHFRLVGDKDEKCRQTRLIRHEGMNGIRFCANPIYHAVVQFDTLYSHPHIRWQLQMYYKDESNRIFKFDAIDLSPNGQIAMECNPEEINVYITSVTTLLKYVIDLPRSGIESLLGNFF